MYICIVLKLGLATNYVTQMEAAHRYDNTRNPYCNTPNVYDHRDNGSSLHRFTSCGWSGQSRIIIYYTALSYSGIIFLVPIQSLIDVKSWWLRARWSAQTVLSMSSIMLSCLKTSRVDSSWWSKGTLPKLHNKSVFSEDSTSNSMDPSLVYGAYSHVTWLFIECCWHAMSQSVAGTRWVVAQATP